MLCVAFVLPITHYQTNWQLETEFRTSRKKHLRLEERNISVDTRKFKTVKSENQYCLSSPSNSDAFHMVRYPHAFCFSVLNFRLTCRVLSSLKVRFLSPKVDSHDSIFGHDFSLALFQLSGELRQGSALLKHVFTLKYFTG